MDAFWSLLVPPTGTKGPPAWARRTGHVEDHLSRFVLEPGLKGGGISNDPLVPVQTRTETDVPPHGRCAEPRQEGLWSRLVAPTGAKRHPRVSISVDVVFVFFERGGGLGVLGGLI